jgi:P27 family predicted phage terminase small subunit
MAGSGEMRGRKPKSNEEKELTGSRRVNKGKRPKAPSGPMKCPIHFSIEERSIWDETLASAPKGVIKPADTELLTTFCEQVAIRRQAMRELAAIAEDNRKPDGSTQVMAVETERGWVKNPLITVADSCAKNIRSLASELGLSPASRERLASKQDDSSEDPWENFGSLTDEAKVQ